MQCACIRPEAPTAALNLAKAYERLGQLEDAEILLREIRTGCYDIDFLSKICDFERAFIRSVISSDLVKGPTPLCNGSPRGYRQAATSSEGGPILRMFLMGDYPLLSITACCTSAASTPRRWRSCTRARAASAARGASNISSGRGRVSWTTWAGLMRYVGSFACHRLVKQQKTSW
jgi:hypothetical protein